MVARALLAFLLLVPVLTGGLNAHADTHLEPGAYWLTVSSGYAILGDGHRVDAPGAAGLLVTDDHVLVDRYTGEVLGTPSVECHGDCVLKEDNAAVQRLAPAPGLEITATLAPGSPGGPGVRVHDNVIVVSEVDSKTCCHGVCSVTFTSHVFPLPQDGLRLVWVGAGSGWWLTVKGQRYWVEGEWVSGDFWDRVEKVVVVDPPEPANITVVDACPGGGAGQQGHATGGLTDGPAAPIAAGAVAGLAVLLIVTLLKR